MEITAKIRDAVSAVARRHGIALVLLFGSFAAGNTRENSDVDIAVRFQDREVSLRRLLEVQEELSGIFPGREIDAVSLERADPLFMKKIAERFLVLYEEPGAADAFLRLAFKRYQDHGKYLAMERDFARRYVEKIAR
ncbi:MAG: polymerase beta domain-containing protein, protein [Deltaproteobacteria bacterium CSP1-8]|jgi:predicted nucleotidyltransferase|nr:MAG: polymerase beta domain-containing protein, protein [Deltaproteobacteria bacterium CSP1-8]